MRGWATVSERRQRLVVSSWSRTAGGPLVGNGWVERVDDPADSAAIGRLVRLALDASREEAPWPDFRPRGHTPEQRRFLQAAGVTNFNQYMHGAIEVWIRLNDRSPGLALEPQRNAGKDGFVNVEDQSIFLGVDVGDEELGSAVRRALDLST